MNLILNRMSMLFKFLMVVISCYTLCPNSGHAQKANSSTTPKSTTTKKKKKWKAVKLENTAILTGEPTPVRRIISEAEMRDREIKRAIRVMTKDGLGDKVPSYEVLDRFHFRDVIFAPIVLSDYKAFPAEFYVNGERRWFRPIYKSDGKGFPLVKKHMKPNTQYRYRFYLSTEKCWYSILYWLDAKAKIQYQIIDCSI